MTCTRCQMSITELPDTWVEWSTNDYGHRIGLPRLVHLPCATRYGYQGVDLVRGQEGRRHLILGFSQAGVSEILAAIDALSTEIGPISTWAHVAERDQIIA